MNNAAAADWADGEEERASWDMPDARCEGCGITCQRGQYLCEVCAGLEVENGA